jgi:tetratricopeptide (TPR) repeat protein
MLPNAKRTESVTWAIGVAAAVLASTARIHPVHAAQTRLAVVVDEFDGAERRDGSQTDVALMQALGTSGDFTFIDPGQASVVRAAAAGQSLLTAPIQKLVTALDADLLLAGEVRFQSLPTGPIRNIVAVKGIGRFRLIAVDSAQVLQAFTAQGVGRGGESLSATSMAADRLAKKLAETLRSAPDAGRRLELVVDLDQPMDAAEARRVAACVGRTPGFENVDTSNLTPELLKLAFEAEFEGEEMAARLSATDCGLLVYRFSSRSLGARYVRGSAGRLSLRLGAFVPRQDLPARDRWLSAGLAEMVGTELSDLDYLQPDPAGVMPAKRARRPQKRTLALVGTFRRQASELWVEARVVATHRTTELVSGQARCSDDDLGACVSDLGRKLGADLYARIRAHRAEIPLGEESVVSRKEALEVVSVKVRDLFPARVRYYDRKPAGVVVVRNDSARRVTRLSLRSELRSFSEDALDTEPVELEPGARVELPVRLRLDADRLDEHNENRVETLQLRLRYRLDDSVFVQRHRSSVTVYDRNAVNWNEALHSVAAFVDNRVDAVQKVAVEVRNALPSDVASDPLAMPLALFHQLSDFAYAPDAVNPFRPDTVDYVLYPKETLARRQGDCDDLAVLYASLVEAAGIPAMLIQTPGHVFVAVGTQVDPSNAESLSMDPDATLVADGRLWLPVETTQVGSSFEAAWDHATEQLRSVRQAGARPRTVVVRSAWRDYPPVDLSGAPPVELPRPIPADRLRAELSALHDKQERALQKALAVASDSEAPADLNRAGVLLVRQGKTEEAERAFRKSLGLRAGPGALNNLGNVKLMQGRTEDALDWYERALGEAPRDIRIALNALLAASTHPDGEAAEAQARYFELALSLDPDAVHDFVARLPMGDTTTGAAADSSALATAAVRLRKLMEARSRPVSRLLASQAGSADLAQHIHWVYGPG